MASYMPSLVPEPLGGAFVGLEAHSSVLLDSCRSGQQAASTTDMTTEASGTYEADHAAVKVGDKSEHGPVDGQGATDAVEWLEGSFSSRARTFTREFKRHRANDEATVQQTAFPLSVHVLERLERAQRKHREGRVRRLSRITFDRTPHFRLVARSPEL